MALCNELASRWKAERVGIGFLKGRYVRLQALSHTEKITRHMQLVQDIEGGMEECLDQDLEILFPPPKDASFVYRSTEKLSAKHGPNSICSFPLRREGKVVAVLTIERKFDKPLLLDEVETLRLTCDLFTARLVDLYEHDRWAGAKAARATRNGLAWFVGAKNTWAKVIAIAVCAFLAITIVVRTDYNVEGSFTFEAQERQIVPAPFEGFLKGVNVQIGDPVWTKQTAAPFDQLANAEPLVPMLIRRPATVLATLETAELESQLAQAKADQETHEHERDIARSQNKFGEMQQKQAEADKSAAQAAQLQWRLDHAAIETPVDGVVFAGDLKQKLGAPVKTGDELFQVGDRDKLRAAITIPEDQIAEVKIGQEGELATSTYPGDRIPFNVVRVDPLAVVSDQHNVFKVRAQFARSDIRDWMKPGMEGIAKVDVGRARLFWIGTHKLVGWVRMKIWQWL
jgi:multidrug efflux pump subunit AcrA (membrane-fusion protein)